MEFSGSGTLYVRAFTASDSLPVENVLVRIRGANEENRLVEYSFLTDRNGLTALIVLPTPEKGYSLSPGAKENPFAVYDIEILGSGFYRKRFFNVAVFADTVSLQPVSMIPVSDYAEDSVYPEGNLDIVIEENEFLK